MLKVNADDEEMMKSDEKERDGSMNAMKEENWRSRCRTKCRDA